MYAGPRASVCIEKQSLFVSKLDCPDNAEKLERSNV